jgi:carboxymethylenebutenolidase
MTTRVSFASKAGDNVEGELALPAGSAKAGGVLVIQEYWGVNDHIRSLVTRLADAGFVALAPDIYRGKITKDANEAGQLMTEMPRERALGDIAGAAAFLGEHARSNGKIAVMGFCMGGAFALRSAAEIPGLAAVISFYGMPDPKDVDWSRVTAKVQGHFAKEDAWAKVEYAEMAKKALESHGQSMDLYVYDAQHAFVNDTRPEVYSPENAKLAWDRAIAFLKQQLA